MSTTTGLTRRRLLSAASAGALGLGLAGTTGCSNFVNARPGPKDFVFTFWGSPVEDEVVSKVIDEFCQSRGLVGKPQHVPGTYNTKINTLIASKTPPDSGYLGGGTAMMFAEQGLISNVAGREGFDSILPQAVHYYADGKAITNSCLEAAALWYNTKATEAGGVRPPASTDQAWQWDDLIENATRLTLDAEGRTPDQSGFDQRTVQQYGIAAPTGLLGLQALMIMGGIELFPTDGTRCNIDHPNAIKVIQSVADLIFEHRVAPTPAQAATFGSNSGLLLESGRVAMLIDGQWALLDFAAADLDYDVGVLPSFGGEYTTMVTSGASVVFTGTRHEQIAAELILQEMTDPRVVSLYRSGLWMPMQERFYTNEQDIEAWLNPEVHPPGYRTAVLEPTFRQSRPEPVYRIKGSDVIFARLNTYIAAMFTKPIDIAAACRTAAEKINPMMRGAYPDTKESA
jgi:multiple sugar transport system substrate-binding protein